MLSIALPNGALQQQCVKRFAHSGITITPPTPESRLYEAHIDDPRFSRAIFTRASFIPSLVVDKKYDLGVTGSDLIAEAGLDKHLVETGLGFNTYGMGGWEIVLVAPKDDTVKRLDDVPNNSVIVSERPRLTWARFVVAGIKIDLKEITGSVESLIGHDYRFGVCTRSSGRTLEANNLKVVEVLMICSTVLCYRQFQTEEKRREIFLLKDSLTLKPTPEAGLSTRAQRQRQK